MTELRRDRWDRPLIQPLDGGKPVAYTRVSTLAKAPDDTTNLAAWKARMAVVGVVSNRHLMQRVASVVNRHDDPVTDGRSALNVLVEEAQTAAGSGRAADPGTVLH